MALDLPHRRRSPGPGVAPALRTFPHQRRPARAGRAELAGRSGRRSLRRRAI